MHLSRYTQPAHQRYIIRILFMVPVYAVCSWISLLDRSAGIYLDTLRDCYESWVIYNFLALCLAYVGGAGNVANRADGREVLPRGSPARAACRRRPWTARTSGRASEARCSS